MKTTVEQRDEAIKLLSIGLSQADVARKINVSRQTISSWMKSPDFAILVQAAKQKLPEIEPKIEKLQNHIFEPSLEEIEFQNYFHKILKQQKHELDFLNEMQEIVARQIKEGSLKACIVGLKISSERRKLLGLDIEGRNDVAKNLAFLANDNLLPLNFCTEIVNIVDKYQSMIIKEISKIDIY